MAGRRFSSNDWGVIVALAIVVLVLGLIFLVERGDPSVADSASASASSARASGPLLAFSTSEAAAGQAAAGMPSATCGDALPSADATRSEEEQAAALDGQRDAAAEELLLAAESAADVRTRAAALYFRAARDRSEDFHAARDRRDEATPPACDDGSERCIVREQRRERDRQSRDALAQLAATTSDAQIYAWSYRACVAAAREAAGGACQLVSALQWARLDADNAEPWLAVAREAKSRNDAAALDDAMFHVATAAAHDAGWGRATAQLVAAAPDSDAAVVPTWLLATRSAAYESVDLASFGDTYRYCDARSLSNANRRDTCEKIATLLADRSTTLRGRSAGIVLGKRLGWPSERLVTLEDERDAGRAVLVRDEPSAEALLACNRVRGELRRWSAVARFGEVEALRRRVVESGASVAALAAEERASARRAIEARRSERSDDGGCRGGQPVFLRPAARPLMEMRMPRCTRSSAASSRARAR